MINKNGKLIQKLQKDKVCTQLVNFFQEKDVFEYFTIQFLFLLVKDFTNSLIILLIQ